MRWGDPRAVGRRRALVAAAVLLAACPEPPPSQADATAAAAADVPPERFRAQAHLDAYARLVPLAQRALSLADPIAEAAITGAAPQPMPFSVGARAALRKAVEAAWIEAAEIRGEFLPAETALLLRSTRFALARLRDEQQRRPSTRMDPSVGVRATARLLDEVVFRGPGCGGCDDALAAAGPELDAAIADLGASTPARARAAAADCGELHARLDAWRTAHPDPTATPGATALGAALDRARDRLLAIAAALEGAGVTRLDREGPRAARAPADVVRLPDRLGAAELRRWLDVHESEAHEAQALFDALSRAALQLGAFAQAAPLDAGAREVDTARCASRWSIVTAFVATQPTLVATFDCARDRLRLPTHADDDELLRALVAEGVVEPTRRAARARTEPLLARVGGEIAPASHRHALSLAVLSGAKQVGARAQAAAAARRDVCTSLVGLWVHGELGDDTALAERLARPCEGINVPALVDDVLARPSGSFAGLGLTLLATGPADAVALERSWWLPLGLVIPAARPGPPPPEVPVEVQTEKLVGGGTEAAGGGAPP